MAREWIPTDDGARTWARVRGGARWRYDDAGSITAARSGGGTVTTGGDMLAGLSADTREKLEELEQRAETEGFKLRWRSGRRTCAEQRALYQIGRLPNDTRKVVTNARGCMSWHVLGRAADADIVAGDKTERGYERLGEIWRELGGVWGGTFPGLRDLGHFEYHPGMRIEQVCTDPDGGCEAAYQRSLAAAASSSRRAAALEGSPIATAPDSGELATVRRLLELHGEGIARATSDPFYRRALLAIMSVECTTGKLPCYGDCRDGSGRVVPCGSPGADAPRSVGLYQLIRSTAAAIGVRFDDLARSADANHAAALKLATRLEGQHAKDFPSLAVLWNAGSVRPDPSNAWGVKTWSPDLVTRYVRRWNAAGVAMREAGAAGGESSSDEESSGGGIGAFLGRLALSWAVKRIVFGD